MLASLIELTENIFFKVYRQKEHIKLTGWQKNKASFSFDLSHPLMHSFVEPIHIETTMYQQQCELIKI